MARTVNQIQKTMLDAVAADIVLSPQLTSTSKRAIWRLWTFIVAVAISVLEQLVDAWRVDIENKVAAAPPGSPLWIQDQVFKFQYSATTPQVIQFINLAPQYPVVDESLRIVTRCSVTTDISNSVTIKVAKGLIPEPLDGLQLAALSSYVKEGIGVAGPDYNVISSEPDRVFVEADIYYKGLFSSVIKSNVILAIDNYLAGIPFNGRVKVDDMRAAVRAVAGVEDIVFKNVSARANATAFGNGTALVQNNTLASRYWPTLAGYAISEDTAGQTLADKLNFISE
jgi:hypothetical protein